MTTTSGPVFCHAPADQAFDVRVLGEPGDGSDRWSRREEPTAYLAADPLTAIAEFARHGDPATPTARTLVRLTLAPVQVLDVRRPDVCAVIGGVGDPERWLDRTVACDTASRLRSASIVQGLLVPSMAFLDRPDRYNVVVFIESIPGGLEAVLSEPGTWGTVRIGS